MNGTQEQVWLPDHAREGILREFTSIKSTMQFLQAIVAAMQGWRDNLQTILPGYRERVVHIRLREGEGGLRLDMPEEVLAKLSDFGDQAGQGVTDRIQPRCPPLAPVRRVHGPSGGSDGTRSGRHL